MINNIRTYNSTESALKWASQDDVSKIVEKEIMSAIDGKKIIIKNSENITDILKVINPSFEITEIEKK